MRCMRTQRPSRTAVGSQHACACTSQLIYERSRSIEEKSRDTCCLPQAVTGFRAFGHVPLRSLLPGTQPLTTVVGGTSLIRVCSKCMAQVACHSKRSYACSRGQTCHPTLSCSTACAACIYRQSTPALPWAACVGTMHRTLLSMHSRELWPDSSTVHRCLSYTIHV